MKILVEEEYGYRCWLWVFPGTTAELIADWKAGKAPLDFFNPSRSDFRGKLSQLRSWEKIRKLYVKVNAGKLAYIHTHEPEDSFLLIGADRYCASEENYFGIRCNPE